VITKRAERGKEGREREKERGVGVGAELRVINSVRRHRGGCGWSLSDVT
jgi:hypothetical protein